MDGKLKRWKNNRNLVKLLQCREGYAESAKFVKQSTQFTEHLIKRLGLEHELKGHQGCVNCLQWSADGRRLISGSDDTNVIYWDPFQHRMIQVIPTPHIGNIFSVKFLGSNDSIIATGAGDCKVIVQSVEDAVVKNAPLLNCGCHMGRVKRLATCPDQPMLFWSAAEDGLVLQYDMREPHECPTQSKIFLDLSFTSEIKCIAVNPTKPNYIAVGVNDCFVRMYDRRKIKLTYTTGTHPFDPRKRIVPVSQVPDCVQYYAPGHLAKENIDITSIKLAATYVAFNSAGTEMLVNIGGEQIYLFDINNSKHINEIIIPQSSSMRKSNIYKPCCHSEDPLNTNSVNTGVFYSDFCTCQCMKRASTLLGRKWMGDVYAAARDYLDLVRHSSDNTQAYIGLIKCLTSLRWTKEASDWLNMFLKEHPDCKDTPPATELFDGIRNVIINQSNRMEDPPAEFTKKVEEDERKRREDSLDYESRFLGHCNTTTDIKEANFLGDEGNYICAGSDEGIIFIWDRKTTEIVRALWGDVSIVNCIQPHPSACFIASSGIDPIVKLWSPAKEDGSKNERIVDNLSSVVEANQQRMSMDPFETMLANMGYRFPTMTEGSFQEVPTCRTS